MVAHHVQRQRVEPGSKPARAVKPADRGPELDADILGNVFRIRRVPAPAPGDSVDEIIVGLDEPCEGISVSGSGLLDQLRVQFPTRF